MDISASFARWRERAVDDPALIDELNGIADDPDAINDRFYRELEFGTAGLRGVLGAGDNRMNIYTVRRATQGLADYLNRRYPTARVAIGYDSRINSERFARESACVLAGNGIAVHLFEELEPTPVLSFAVRELHCQAGIVVTASHNPAKYNGYKCYGAEGFQMTDDDANAVTACIRQVDIFDGVRLTDYDAAVADGMITLEGEALVNAFLDRVATKQVHPGICREAGLKVIYTPLNGTGNKPVRAILERIGQPVTVVPEQELPDGHFPTAPYPNPEIRQAFECALAMAKQEPADLLLATDPDCDRVGIAVRNGDDYTLLTGNQTGCLLLEYLLSNLAAAGKLPAHPVVIKTIVTSDLATRIAETYGCEMREVLTGFKYIGEQIGLLEEAGHPERYLLGFEESYGYLIGTHARDKDAVVASMLICEMAAYYKTQGKTLLEVLDGLYRRHGVYLHRVTSKEFDGEQGMNEMAHRMESLHQTAPTVIGGLRVLAVADYERSVRTDLATGAASPITLPRSNVIAFTLENHAGFIVRPSGTEPKIKCYITATGADMTAAEAVADRLLTAAEELLQ